MQFRRRVGEHVAHDHAPEFVSSIVDIDGHRIRFCELTPAFFAGTFRIGANLIERACRRAGQFCSALVII